MKSEKNNIASSLICLVVASIIIYGCNANDVNKSVATDSKYKKLQDTLDRSFSFKGKSSSNIDSLVKIIKSGRDSILILSCSKKSNFDSIENEFYSKCKNWELNALTVKEILKRVVPITSHELHYLYYVLPCEMKGKLKINEEVFDYTLNAGSFVTLSNSDTTLIFGIKGKATEKFFLVNGGDSGNDL